MAQFARLDSFDDTARDRLRDDAIAEAATSTHHVREIIVLQAASHNHRRQGCMI